MLDKPDFVGSYEVGDHVYFFFREMAVEYMNCGRAVYSRYLLYHPISGLILNVPVMTNTTLLDFLQGCQSLQEGHWWEEHLGSELGHLLEGQAKLLHPRRVPLLLQRDPGRLQGQLRRLHLPRRLRHLTKRPQRIRHLLIQTPGHRGRIQRKV